MPFHLGQIDAEKVADASFPERKKSGKSLNFLTFLRFDTMLGLKNRSPANTLLRFFTVPSVCEKRSGNPTGSKEGQPTLLCFSYQQLYRAGESFYAAPGRSASAAKRARPLRLPTREGRDFRKRYFWAFPITSRSQTVSSAGSSVRMSRTEISAPRESSSPMAEI